jgi:ADP-heptose:LPS heptosyltransferase
MAPRSTAVVRFSSLGDVLLAAHVPSFLKRANPGERVSFVTKARYAQVLAGHPDLDDLLLLDDESGAHEDVETGTRVIARGSLPDLAATLRDEGVGTIVDLHGNLRSAALRRAVRPGRIVRAPKHGLKRRLMVHAKWILTGPPPLPAPTAFRRLRADAPSPVVEDALDARRDRARAAEARGPRAGAMGLRRRAV